MKENVDAKALSEEGNPSLDTVGNILHGLGFRFSIVPLQQARRY